jgi:hypothetical protein
VKLPESDWNCSGVLDAKAIDADGQSACEFCGTIIRWIHVLEHDDHPKSMQAGCCCAVRLCCDYDAEAAERDVKNRMGRRLRFMNLRRWKQSRVNRENVWRFVRTPDGSRTRVTVFLKDGWYSICFATPKDRFFHHLSYATQAEAMSVAFELIERLKEQDDADSKLSSDE